jgi:hypothetical protein
MKKEEEEEKRRQWEAIKLEAPELAGFLTEINLKFGKPAAVEIEINGKAIIKSGTFEASHITWNGKLRGRAHGKR